MSPRPARVHGRRQFEALRRNGRRVRVGPVTVHFLYADAGDEVVAVAYTVGRKVGGAVVRNRCRRRLRAVVATVVQELHPGTYLIGVGREATTWSFDELKERVVTTMRRAQA